MVWDLVVWDSMGNLHGIGEDAGYRCGQAPGEDVERQAVDLGLAGLAHPATSGAAAASRSFLCFGDGGGCCGR